MNLRQTIRSWSWFKKTLFYIALVTFLTSSFLFLTPPGGQIREWLAETVITTQHRSWAWIFVGAERRDLLVQKMQNDIELAALEQQNLGLVNIRKNNKKNRTIDELVKVEDISGQFWKGKKLTVYDPTTIKIMTPSKVGEGERITSMAKRTGAVAGVNGGAFNDPEGLGNGFAALGMILSEGEIIFTDQDGSIPQHIVGFTKEGRLVVGKYDAFELKKMGVTEAVSFYPRLIANGKGLITNGDGGWGRAPRTAIGQRPDGTVIILVIDGRQSHSVGATLKELQDLLLDEGCVIAGNLDGGASSELVYDGELISKPSSRYGERRLPSAFLVYDHPETVKAPRIWDGVDKIDAGGSYDHPDFLREQAEKKAKGQTSTPSSNSTQTPAAKPATQPKAEQPASSTETKSGSSSGNSEAPVPAPASSSETKAIEKPDAGSQAPAAQPSTKPSSGSGTTGSAPSSGTTTKPAPASGDGTKAPGTSTTQAPGASGASTTKP